MPKLRVLVGTHVQNHPQNEKDEDGRIKNVAYREGETFDNKEDLAARWPEKFARVYDESASVAVVDPPKLPPANLPKVDPNKPLDKMVIKELMAIVEEEEIETGGNVTDRNALIALIKKSRGEK